MALLGASFAILGGWEETAHPAAGTLGRWIWDVCEFGMAVHQHSHILGQKFISPGGWQKVAPGTPGHPEATSHPKEELTPVESTTLRGDAATIHVPCNGRGARGRGSFAATRL